LGSCTSPPARTAQNIRPPPPPQLSLYSPPHFYKSRIALHFFLFHRGKSAAALTFPLLSPITRGVHLLTFWIHGGTFFTPEREPPPLTCSFKADGFSPPSRSLKEMGVFGFPVEDIPSFSSSQKRRCCLPTTLRKRCTRAPLNRSGVRLTFPPLSPLSGVEQNGPPLFSSNSWVFPRRFFHKPLSPLSHIFSRTCDHLLAPSLFERFLQFLFNLTRPIMTPFPFPLKEFKSSPVEGAWCPNRFPSNCSLTFPSKTESFFVLQKLPLFSLPLDVVSSRNGLE